jgi:hypothetical protein
VKTSRNLWFLDISLIWCVYVAPIHVRADRQVIIWPQAGFALWALASVGKNRKWDSKIWLFKSYMFTHNVWDFKILQRFGHIPRPCLCCSFYLKLHSELNWIGWRGRI